MVKTALRSVFKYNWIPDLTNWRHDPRAFAGAKDKGLIICTWPKGGELALPFVYSNEVWTGIEYQVASHLMRAGLVTTVRKTRGDDIDAACGQLAGKVLDKTRRTSRALIGTEK